ncbi:TniQ family protein, partial [Leptospira sp. SA-E8]|uniref:TniQ family protein n=1 Tax=Leptospira sp. SA-E8 TaxID=3422259 RepID=UPI003EBCD894
MSFKTKLPLNLSLHDDESGVGVCLRIALANGFNLHWLRREAGFRESNVIDGRGAAMLASVLQIDSEWLLHRLVTARREKSGNSWKFFGHLLYARCHVRRSRPQVCPECIHQFGYCRAEWDFSLVTACRLHATPLVDWCRHCRSTFRWDRPGIE